MGLGRNLLKGTKARTLYLLHNNLHRTLTGDVARATVDMLPDVALLEIFDFYVDDALTEAWHTLVHVCRKWRNVIFGSPLRLNLLLSCDARTPVKETIDVWPLLPILVWGHGHEKWGVDNIIGALEHNDRIPQLDLDNLPSSQMEKVLAAMRQPFTALEVLYLKSRSETVVVPASFLGGSAPQLQELCLTSIPFPGLPKLLLSATHLVELRLNEIPHSGYFSPEAMVTGLSAMTRLKCLEIVFESPRSRPDRRRRPPPLTRTLLPTLTCFEFKGVSEYLDDLVAWIDAPLLDYFDATFFHQLIFDTPQLAQFISRTPNLRAGDSAHVEFSGRRVWVASWNSAFTLAISCSQSDWQLLSLAQIWSSIFIHTMKRVRIFQDSSLRWQDDIETSQWLELLHAFTAVKSLHISPGFTPNIVPTLQELVGERVIEVLPALQTLFLGVSAQESIRKFITARELASFPIAVSYWTS